MTQKQIVNTQISEIIFKASKLSELTDKEVLFLGNYSEDHIDDLCNAASSIRDYGKGFDRKYRVQNQVAKRLVRLVAS